MAIEEVIFELKNQFDDFHNIRHKARKLIEKNRLEMLQNDLTKDESYFSEFMLDDKEDYDFVKQILDLE